MGSYVNGKTRVLAKQYVRTSVRVVALFAIAATLLLSVFANLNVSAQSQTNTANTLKVSPVRSDIQVSPGESKVVETTVTNLTDSPISVRPILNDFIAGDERGTPALILDEEDFAPTHSLKRFMQPLEDVTIAPKQAVIIPVTIEVPSDAQAGGYFGAVRFAPTTPDSGGQVNLSASVASIILLTVPGDTIEQLDLTYFDIQQNGVTNTFFNSPDNLQVAFRFQNKGNVQVGPTGKISVTQGDKVVYETDFNNKDQRDQVLPDSARRWEVPLDKIGSFGNYTVTATLTYGSQNKTIEAKKSFWVVPMALIIGAVVGLLVLIGIIVGIVWFLRGYKRRILNNNGGGGRYRY